MKHTPWYILVDVAAGGRHRCDLHRTGARQGRKEVGNEAIAIDAVRR